MADRQIPLFFLVSRVISPDRCGQWNTIDVPHRDSLPSGLGQVGYLPERLMRLQRKGNPAPD